MSQHAQEYSASRTARERLLVCIAAIDDAVIDVGVDVDDLRALFAGDFTDLGAIGSDGARSAAMVTFERQAERHDRNGPVDAKAPSQGPEGWYLYVEYDKSGHIRRYHLSDVHKDMPKRPR